jgi:hypothetical protein
MTLMLAAPFWGQIAAQDAPARQGIPDFSHELFGLSVATRVDDHAAMEPPNPAGEILRPAQTIHTVARINRLARGKTTKLEVW